MDCNALIQLVRTTIDDKIEPYLVEDVTIVDYLNEAVQEACVRGRLLHRLGSRVSVQADENHFILPDGIYEIENVINHGVRLKQTSRETMDCESVGLPRHVHQTDTLVYLHPRPDRLMMFYVDGYAVPVGDELMADGEDSPVINEIHHRKLVSWVVHKLFEIPDTEIFDANKSARALAEFADYFGLSPDSDLRRITREDRPQTVTPFWV